MYIICVFYMSKYMMRPREILDWADEYVNFDLGLGRSLIELMERKFLLIFAKSRIWTYANLGYQYMVYSNISNHIMYYKQQLLLLALCYMYFCCNHVSETWIEKLELCFGNMILIFCYNCVFENMILIRTNYLCRFH